ncbi:MAG TPA: AraC family transcriptional regulator [Gemmatimonadota bacterium]|nr:AraC family transcriptional regulator [Gemmatimonadota bacterium]
MGTRFVPVHMGSPRFDVVNVGGFRITDAWFPAGEVLPPHVHERPIFATMLSGSFLDVFRTVTHECTPSTVFTEPAGERHANRIQDAGAHVLVIQPDPVETERLRPASRFWEEIHCFRHGVIADRARQLSGEVRSPDAVTPIAIEALVLEMLALAARLEAGDGLNGRPPAWLERAQDLVHDRFQEKLRLQDVATAVDVHPSHLAKTFRNHFHVSLGTYIRRLRIEWATRQVAETGEPLSAIAARAGFADQSHFTREFRKRNGLSPRRYRDLRKH